MWRRGLHRLERSSLYYVIRFLRIRQATEHIARGFAVGLIPNFFPTFGFGFVMSAFLARVAGGSIAAGAVGGLSLTFLWPLLFFVNMQTGSLFIHPRILIDDLDDVTEKNIKALLWGPAFTTGAILNSLLASTLAYVAILLFYRQVRPGALRYFRRHARDHQRRFRRERTRGG
jgi:hypothetical protein